MKLQTCFQIYNLNILSLEIIWVYSHVSYESWPGLQNHALAESVLVAMPRLVMDDIWVAWVLFGIRNVFVVMLATGQLMIMRSKSHVVYLYFNLKLLNIMLQSFSYSFIILSLWALSECCIWPNFKVSFLVIVFSVWESPFS